MINNNYSTNIRVGIPNQEYRQMEGLSKTNLDWINRSPAHYKCFMENPPEATAAMEKGIAFHLAALEPNLFDERITVWTDGRKYGKAWEAFLEQHQGKVIITGQDHEDIKAMVEAIHNHPAALRLLAQKERLVEPSVFGEIMGVKCKARPDLIMGAGYEDLVDLKSTTNASPFEFKKAIYNFRYHVQAAFGIDVVAKALNQDPELVTRTFFFIAVEKDPPYAVAVYEAEPEVIELGRQGYQANLRTFVECTESNRWPAYSDEIETIGLPPWAKKKEDIYE